MAKTYFYNGEEIEENQLLLRIRNGEDQLFAIISTAYLPIINKYVSLLECSNVDREDFVQIGLLALCGAINAYDFSSASFATFASICIKRSIISELRHISSKKHINQFMTTIIDENSLLEENDPETAFLNKENINVLTDKIKLVLSSFEYKAFNAYLKFGNYSEAALSLNVSVKEISNALQRARKKIRKSIGSGR